MSVAFGLLKRTTLEPQIPVIKSKTDIQLQRQLFQQKAEAYKFSDVIADIYDLLKNIRDPEHPYTLEQLDNLKEEDIEIYEQDDLKILIISWKPATPTYSLATHIGLSIYIKLERDFADFKSYKLSVLIKDGTHKNKSAVDRQVNDKERIEAAKENEKLMTFIETLIS
mmetsp:Transcript_8375/g.9467  ORF Transcript_8375/g.9467 Transcript_8375/m.9467 type:complete len:168 (+) Transcript_8375:29-532(+)